MYSTQVLPRHGSHGSERAGWLTLQTATQVWSVFRGDCSPSPRGCHVAAAAGCAIVVHGGSAAFDPQSQQCRQFFADTFSISDGMCHLPWLCDTPVADGCPSGGLARTRRCIAMHRGQRRARPGERRL